MTENTRMEFNNAWKSRGTLANLVKELERQKETRVDFVADTRNFQVAVQPDPRRVLLAPETDSAREWLPDGLLPFNDRALVQLAAKTDPSIPKRFFDRMLEIRPQRLEELINNLHKDSPQKRLVRCLDNEVRAWLSNSYWIIDNYDMAFTCMDAAQRCAGQVIEANLTDTHMRIKFTSQQIWDAIDIKQRTEPRGNWFAGALGNRELIGKTILGATVTTDMPGGPGTIHPLITISNSETGHGGFAVRIGILMGICYNVATLEDVIVTTHLSGRMPEGVYTQETMSAESKAVMLKARDAVHAAFNQDKFRNLIAVAKRAQATEVTDVSSAVTNIMQEHDIREEQREALLAYFVRDYDQTQFGLSQAVGRLAQDTDDGNEADHLERAAGKILCRGIYNVRQQEEVCA